MFGWVHRDTGLRRFVKGLFLLAVRMVNYLESGLADYMAGFDESEELIFILAKRSISS